MAQLSHPSMFLPLFPWHHLFALLGQETPLSSLYLSLSLFTAGRAGQPVASREKDPEHTLPTLWHEKVSELTDTEKYSYLHSMSPPRHKEREREREAKQVKKENFEARQQSEQESVAPASRVNWRPRKLRQRKASLRPRKSTE